MLHYFWGVDAARIVDGFSVDVTDSSGAAGADRTFTVTIASGLFAHVDFSTIVTGYEDFAGVLQAALIAGSLGGTIPRDYEVTFDTANGYTIAVGSGTKLTLDFTTSTAKTNLKRLLGMTGDRTLALEYSSQVRPYYWLIPSIQGRSEMSDEQEPDDIASEASADDGSVSVVAKDTSEVLSAWVQNAEPVDQPGSFTFDDPWSPPFERHATAAVPWTYQHAFRHARTGALPFLVVDGSESAVHELLADGMSFRPTRFAGRDIQIWSIPFQTRLRGRL